MAQTEQPAPARVSSPDGTQIAFWASGGGPPLLLVHGGTADHTRWRTVLPYLEPHTTVYAMDRRGRGASADAPTYDLAREYEDIAAVVDAIAAASASAVTVLGHSFGGVCAFGAARLTSNIGRLVLYEGWPAPNPALVALPAQLRERMNDLLVAGEREAALEVFFREGLQMPEHEFAVYRALPAWQRRIAAAHTVLREERALAHAVFDPEQAATIAIPVLLLVGADSPPAIQADYETVAAALPDTRVVILEGQQHIAMDLIPQAFAQHVLDFLPGAARPHGAER